ncbi:hypothetical protein TNCV_2184611 [Trichonephila clavipes]|nr:hypothetical protein TNCV_2184611 [Trichonephila clavipes]
MFRWWIHPCDGCKEFMKIVIHQLVTVRSSFNTNAFMLLPNQCLVKRKIIVIASLLSLNQVPSERRRGDYLQTGCGNAIRSLQPFPFALANAFLFYTSDIHNEKQLN